MFTALLLCLAPVPPAPEKIREEYLYGTWSYEWGNWPSGEITFSSDGTYESFHELSGDRYAGHWCWENRTLTLREGKVLNGVANPSCSYKVDFDICRYPTLTGSSGTGTKVILSNPRRKQE